MTFDQAVRCSIPAACFAPWEGGLQQGSVITLELDRDWTTTFHRSAGTDRDKLKLS